MGIEKENRTEKLQCMPVCNRFGMGVFSISDRIRQITSYLPCVRKRAGVILVSKSGRTKRVNMQTLLLDRRTQDMIEGYVPEGEVLTALVRFFSIFADDQAIVAPVVFYLISQ